MWNHLRAIGIPTIGGLLVGLAGWAIARWWNRRTVDPIEANALHGGRMSLSDSLFVTAQTVLSNASRRVCRAGGGLYPDQFGAGLAARPVVPVCGVTICGLLVGCGAAGAIAAAFQAPLTGSFYAFELVIGTYSLVSLAPVVVSAIVAVFVTRVLSTDTAGFDIRVPSALEPVDYLPILALGHGVRPGRHPDHARRDPGGILVPEERGAGLVAPGAGRGGGWRPGAVVAAGAVLRA